MDIRAQFESHLLALLRQRPTVHLPSVKQLEQLCQRQLEDESIHGWRTFWSLSAHFFEGLRMAPGRSFGDAETNAASQVLSGLLLRDQFNKAPGEAVKAKDAADSTEAESHDISEDHLQTINHVLFLEQADAISQRLVSLLNDWSESPEGEAHVLDDVRLDAQSMAQLAQDVELTAVQQVADSLATQLARLRTTRVVDDIKTSLKGAQEVSRLLQHFAVGNLRAPQENVLAALRGE
jgi:hypothetical protein